MTKKWIVHKAKSRRYRKKAWKQRHRVNKIFKPKKRTRASLNFGFTPLGSVSPLLDKAEENLRRKKMEREILAKTHPGENLPAVFKREELIRRLDSIIEREERALQQARENLNVKT